MNYSEVIKKTVLRRRIAVIIAYVALKKQPIKKRRWWIHPINQRRINQGDWENLIQEMRRDDSAKFFEYTRLTVDQFDYLLELVKDKLTKCDEFRQIIPPGARLIITLRHLATGDGYPTLAFAYRIGKSTVCNIIKETCEVIWNSLSATYIDFPKEDEWKIIAEQFEIKWNLPHCIGAIDGKHCKIKAPDRSGSTFFNYKKHFSIILFAVCDAYYIFTYIDIGAYGADSDGGVLKNSSFGKSLLNNTLQIPKEENLPNTNIKMPYFFVGDEAFPLHNNLLRPYGGRNVETDKRIFNYRLSRARRCIENAFGILVSRFRIFHKTIFADPTTVDSIIKAAVCLHNFIKIRDHMKYCPPGYTDTIDTEGNIVLESWRNSMQENCLKQVNSIGKRIGTRNISKTAGQLRDIYKEYLSTVGVVPWQNNVLLIR